MSKRAGTGSKYPNEARLDMHAHRYRKRLRTGFRA
jgi:hypothetical protein